MNSENSRSVSTSTWAIIRLNSKWRIEALNKAAETLIGMAAGELTGKPLESVISSHPESAGLRSLAELVGAGAIIRNHPIRIDGTTAREPASHLATILPCPGNNGKTAGALLFIEEPSAQPAPHLILNSVADGIFTVDRDWIITSFNRAAQTITGWRAETAIGRSCSEVLQSSICGKNCTIAQSLYSGRPVANRSITIRTIDGEKIPISISASPLADHEGNIIGGVEIFRDLSYLTAAPRLAGQRFGFDRIFSRSKSMQRLLAILPEIAASPSTVLICGESGTGKELVARALANMSDRRDMPFVALNCGALPESLLESELFGYKAGAFTDARKDKEGRFAAAEGGILFLDEIGDIPRSLQVKLLRVLQEKVYEPLGSNTPVRTDVRIITATNRDLAQLVGEGKFREDLYYRLNVVRIQLPPLQERKEDIPLLIDQFIDEFSSRMAKDIVGISPQALSILMLHDFPGNIRELKNIIDYAFILCDGGYILPEHLPEPFGAEAELLEPFMPHHEERPLTLEETEKQAIYMALERNGGKKNATCAELGISRDTLRRKLIKYNLELPETDLPDDSD